MTHELTLDSEEVALIVGLLALHGFIGEGGPRGGDASHLPLPEGFDHYDVENVKASLERQVDIDDLDVEDEGRDDEHDQFRSDVEADADVLASAGFGTDEDYGGGDDERY